MPVKIHSHSKIKSARNGTLTKHVAEPASYSSILKTYGLTKERIKRLQDHIEKRLGHALTN
jgi:hypothetical protein